MSDLAPSSRRHRIGRFLGTAFTWLADHMIRPPVLIPLMVLLATWVGFQMNAGLYKRAALASDWYDATLIVALLLPPLTGHLTAWMTGHHSGFWWGLWIPTVALYWLRPWQIDTGWAFFWREHLDLWTHFVNIFRLQEQAPLRSFIRLGGVLTMALVTFMVAARSWLRLTAWLRDLGRDAGDGTGTAGGGRTGKGKAEGLPQATWVSAGEVRDQQMKNLPGPQPGLRHTQEKSEEKGKEEDFGFDLEGDVEAPAEMQNEAVLSGVDPAAPEPEDAQPPVRSPVAHGAIEATDPAPMTDYKARTQKRIADALAQKACTQKAREAATPTGGQRILLDDAGKAVPVTPAKPSFGSLSGCPARFPTGDGIDAGEPLLVAEGPETALTLRLATGYETWTVFGVSNWQSAPLPLDRDIILAPDRDAALSPAGKTFRKAVAHHLQRGCRLRIAPAPEPEGSKKDLNDTLMDQGIAAVRAALDAAHPPGPEDLPNETADKNHESESHGETAGASETRKNGKDTEKDTEKDDEQPKGQSGPGGSE